MSISYFKRPGTLATNMERKSQFRELRIELTSRIVGVAQLEDSRHAKICQLNLFS